MRKLRFAISIKSPRKNVWQTMLEPETYREWTEAFTPGSYYEGSWTEGAKIRFLSPGGEGMTAEIAENREYEFVSIRHLGFVKGGVDDTNSPEATAWAPAYENYSFHEADGTTEVVVEIDSNDGFEKMFKEVWPKALQRLKEMCER